MLRLAQAKANMDMVSLYTMDEAIEASAKAQKEYMNHSMADRQRYVEGIREVVCTKENLEYMSKLAVEESGMGAYEYKVIKTV